tara:strand:+ start:14299 stop:20718 length:6420 start_codon:yes stop_codon:yes gene_type:complete
MSLLRTLLEEQSLDQDERLLRHKKRKEAEELREMQENYYAKKSAESIVADNEASNNRPTSDTISSLSKRIERNKNKVEEYVSLLEDKNDIDENVKKGLSGQLIDLTGGQEFNLTQAYKDNYIKERIKGSRVDNDSWGSSNVYDAPWKENLNYNYVNFISNDYETFVPGLGGMIDDDETGDFNEYVKNYDDPNATLVKKFLSDTTRKGANLGPLTAYIQAEHAMDMYQNMQNPGYALWYKTMQDWKESGVPSREAQHNLMKEVYGLDYDYRQATDSSFGRGGHAFLKELTLGYKAPHIDKLESRSAYDEWAYTIGSLAGFGASFLVPYGAAAKVTTKGSQLLHKAAFGSNLVKTGTSAAGAVNATTNLQRFAKWHSTTRGGSMLNQYGTNLLAFNAHGQMYKMPENTTLMDRLEIAGHSTAMATLFTGLGSIGRLFEGGAYLNKGYSRGRYWTAKGSETPLAFGLGYAMTPDDPDNPHDNHNKIINGLFFAGLHSFGTIKTARGVVKDTKTVRKRMQKMQDELGRIYDRGEVIRGADGQMHRVPFTKGDKNWLSQRNEPHLISVKTKQGRLENVDSGKTKGEVLIDTVIKKLQSNPMKLSHHAAQLRHLNRIIEKEYHHHKVTPEEYAANKSKATDGVVANLQTRGGKVPTLAEMNFNAKSKITDMPEVAKINTEMSNLAKGSSQMSSVNAQAKLDKVLSEASEGYITDSATGERVPITSEQVMELDGLTNEWQTNINNIVEAREATTEAKVETPKIETAKPEPKPEVSEAEDIAFGDAPTNVRTKKPLKQFSKPVTTFAEGQKRLTDINNFISNKNEQLSKLEPESKRYEEISGQVYEAQEYKNNLQNFLADKGIIKKPETGTQFASDARDPLMTTEQAIENVGSPKAVQFQETLSKLDKELGLKADLDQSAGFTEEWGDENSLVSTVEGTSPDVRAKMRVRGAYVGMMGKQKDVVNFYGDEAGPHRLHKMTIPTELVPELKESLTEFGLDNKTIIPRGDKSEILIWDQNDLDINTIERIADYYDTNYETEVGEFESLTGYAGTTQQANRAYLSILGQEAANTGQISQIFRENLPVFRSKRTAKGLIDRIGQQQMMSFKIKEGTQFKNLTPDQQSAVLDGNADYFRNSREWDTSLEFGSGPLTPANINNMMKLTGMAIDAGRNVLFADLPRFIRKQAKGLGIDKDNWTEMMQNFETLPKNVQSWMKKVHSRVSQLNLRNKQIDEAIDDFEVYRSNHWRRGETLPPDKNKELALKANKAAHMIEDWLKEGDIVSDKLLKKHKKKLFKKTNSLADLLKENEKGELLNEQAAEMISYYVYTLRAYQNIGQIINGKKMNIGDIGGHVKEISERSAAEQIRKLDNDHALDYILEDHQSYVPKDKTLLEDAKIILAKGPIQKPGFFKKLVTMFNNTEGFADIIQQQMGIPAHSMVENAAQNHSVMEQKNDEMFHDLLQALWDVYGTTNHRKIDVNRMFKIQAVGQGKASYDKDLNKGERRVYDELRKILDKSEHIERFKVNRFQHWKDTGSVPRGVKKGVMEELDRILVEDGAAAFKEQLNKTDGLIITENYMPNLEEVVGMEEMMPESNPNKDMSAAAPKSRKNMGGAEGNAIDNVIRWGRTLNAKYYLDPSVQPFRDVVQSGKAPLPVDRFMRKFVKELYNRPDDVDNMYVKGINMGIGMIMKTAFLGPEIIGRNLAQVLTGIQYMPLPQLKTYMKHLIKQRATIKGQLDVTKNPTYVADLKSNPLKIQAFMSGVANIRGIEEDMVRKQDHEFLRKMGVAGEIGMAWMNMFQNSDTTNRWGIYSPVYDHVMSQIKIAANNKLKFLEKSKSYDGVSIGGKNLPDVIMWDHVGQYKSVQDALRPVIDKALQGDELAMHYLAHRIAKHIAGPMVNWDYRRFMRSVAELGSGVGKMAMKVLVYPMSLNRQMFYDVQKIYQGGQEYMGGRLGGRGDANRGKRKFWGGFKGLVGRLAIMKFIEEILLGITYGQKDETNEYGWGYRVPDAFMWSPGSIADNTYGMFIDIFEYALAGDGKMFTKSLHRASKSMLPGYKLAARTAGAIKGVDDVQPLVDLYDTIMGNEYPSYQQREIEFNFIQRIFFGGGFKDKDYYFYEDRKTGKQKRRKRTGGTLNKKRKKRKRGSGNLY